MARGKTPGLKKRLGKAAEQTKWAPFWTVPKMYRKMNVHPGRHTAIKRSWRRSKLKV
jgi:ribosomal protein L39E